jgi:formate hydrogenlyase subunit 4/hydrogenase-4 membrane subunit HyfE
MTRDLILQFLAQGAQMTFVLLIAPLAVGVVRRVKARLMRRQGPPLLQGYFDLAKLLRKESVIAESASWLFRSAPYLIFALTWVAAALVPSFASGLMFNWAADVVALVALLGAARALLALAGMDVGTSFGGIGSSREMMIATLAEPAMMLIVLTLAIAAGTTRLAGVADFFIAEPFAVRVSLGLSLVALIIVALAENARIPVDNPVTHLELTMVHEAMVLEYSGRHLALIEAASHLKLVLYLSLLICLFTPFGMAPANAGVAGWAIGLAAWTAKVLAGARRVGGEHRQDARLPSARFRRHRLRVRLPRHPAGVPDARGILVNQAYEISHLLAGAMLVTSFALLYQERVAAVLNAFAAQSIILALAVAWAAWSGNRPDLFITALIALTLKGIVIPLALRHTVTRLGIHREVEKVVGVGVALLVGLALTGLAQALVVKVASGTASHAREELALALAIILLGFLMMIVRRNAVTQIVGFMSMENGLILAATGARGMPLVVEVSVAFSVLIALFVFAVFVFRIRERFDTVDIEALDRMRGDRR